MRGLYDRLRGLSLGAVLCWALALAWLAWALIRTFGLERGYPLVPLMAYTPWVAAGAIVPLAVTALTRRWWALVATTVAAVLLVVAVAPRALGGATDPSQAEGPRLDVLTANLKEGEADLGEVVEAVREHEVDLLAVQELTAEGARAFERLGLERLLPHAVLERPLGSVGSGVYSRHPLSEMKVEPMPFARAAIRVPGASGPVEVVSVHALPPTNGDRVDEWRDDLRTLPPAEPDGGPLRIEPGDFNATLDHDELRKILDSGYVDAADVAGEGLTPTWRVERVLPPPVTIDHVLVDRRADVIAVEVLELPGSDHRMVLAALGL
jgi:endonuclease/exonuclease/phosphatase family metal-dependent hydrolase